MTTKPIFYLFIPIIISFSCKQNPSYTFDYSLLQVDTNKINIFKYDSTLYAFPKFSEPMPLINDDIKLVDSLLFDAVNKFNQTTSKAIYEDYKKQFSIDSFTIDLKKYKRQYFPYKDNNGQRVFHIVCFSKEFPEWKHKIYNRRFHGGSIVVFELRINLDEKKADEFYISGFGG